MESGVTNGDGSGAAEEQDDAPGDVDVIGGLAREELHSLLGEMLLYRRFEEKAEEAYAIGKIGGFCHLHIGQEGLAAGAIRPLRADDLVITAYRDHTMAIAKGITPRAAMAELYGRVDGCSGGRGGSMHLFDPTVGFMGGHGIVGGQIPIGTGLGWAIRYRGDDQVCVCFMGDAAVNQGAFLESLNMAAIWHLPVIYVVENNEYGMGTAFSRVSATEMEARSGAYGIPAHTVNGQDVLETYRFFADMAERVRGGAGPQFVNAETYRFRGHSMSDPVSGTYRSKEEVESHVQEQDPITILRDRLMEADLLTQAELEAMDAEVRAVCEDAAEFADASPVPDPATLYDNVYAEVNAHGRLFLDGRGPGPAAGGPGGATHG
ncbi:MAG: pyruvate dehydrogenase (acetyl-transferring) E1 component subunit alpha [Gemmatimonadetes bacterium]|nr:pyruvate dehydrogenase (acetyl-transferring) E1 component subunit alpha [Gemmatimonadota bacterium]MYD14162.1 pyruvate dehydrogenase (acetyl-transferring) E1 component subunit alpha [Gemmatimonadota bacterium]MYI66840.1 pyruvate dehydrogenase (acetyl-transferring) E1 component subunit alpha [Gemmatimonadota bacterium]